MSDDPFNYSGKLDLLAAVACDPRCNRADIAVTAQLVLHADRQGQCFPGITRLVALSQCSRSAVLRSVKKLEGIGVIAVVRKFGCSSTYQLTRSGHETGVAVGTGVISNLRRGPTGSGGDTDPVPVVTPEVEVKLKAIRKEDAARPVDPLWDTGLQFLIRKGVTESQARPFLGKICKAVGQVRAVQLLAQAEAEDVVDPKGWLAKAAVPGARVQRLARDLRTDTELAAANEAQARRMEACA